MQPYNREAFLLWTGRLVGLDYQEERRRQLGRDDALPIVLLTGGRGSGKSELTAALAARYSNRTPLAQVDLATPRDANPLAPDESALVRLLQELLWQLPRKTKDVGRLPLPRLTLGLLVLSLWGTGERVTAPQARQRLNAVRPQVERLLQERTNSEGLAAEWVSETASEVGGALVGTVAPLAVSAFVKAAIKVLVKKAFGFGRSRAPLHWWEQHRPNQAGDAAESLLDVTRDFHNGGPWRKQAEGELVAAFLADVRHSFGEQHLLRLRRPLLLLDNLDADPGGQRLIELVLENRRNGPTDPLVVVATAPTRMTRLAVWTSNDTRDDEIPTVLVEDFPLDALPSAPGLPLAVKLTALNEQQTLHVFNKLLKARNHGPEPTSRPSGDIPDLVQRFTGGLTLGVAALATAVVRTPDTKSTALLGLPLPGDFAPDAPGAGSVGAYLLRRLIPDRQARADLTVFSVAHDTDAAERLAKEFVYPDRQTNAVREATTLLAREGWLDDDCGGFYVGDRFLRALLLHRLRTPRVGEPSWTEVLRCLADPEVPPTAVPDEALLRDDESAYLRHALSQGRNTYVVKRLQATFAASDPETWLRAFAFIADAPDAGTSVDRWATALGRARAESGGASANDIQLAVDRLLHGVWYHLDPLAVADNQVLNRVRINLEHLATSHRPGGQVLFDAAEEWPGLLRQGRRLACWRRPAAREGERP